MAFLRERGSRIGVVEMQGELCFASAEVVSRTVCESLAELDFLILDGRRVSTMDTGAREVLAGVRDMAAASDVQLLCSALRCAPTEATFTSVDDALEWCEEELLRDCEGLDRQTGELAMQQLLAGLDADALAAVDEIAEVRRYGPGEVVFSEGDEADGIYSVMSGSLSICIAAGHDQQRIATLGQGATFGEMAVLDGKPRSTTVVADCVVVCKVLTFEALGGDRSAASSAALGAVRQPGPGARRSAP